jgi:hypothetical protein
VESERPDVRIRIDQEGTILGEPAWLHADLRMDPAAGLFRVDFRTWYLDSRETRPKWRPKATLIGPLVPAYDILGGDSPFDLSDSYITASAFSNSKRILAAADRPAARWISLNDDPARPGYGLRRTDFFDYVSAGYRGEKWGNARRGGSTEFVDGLPRTVETHSRDGLDRSRALVTFDWGEQDVGTLPPSPEVVSMRDFLKAKQSVDWRSVISSYRDEVAFSTCLNSDPTFPRPIGSPRRAGDGLWRSTLRAFAREFPREGWPEPIRWRSSAPHRAVVWFKDPLTSAKRSMTITNPLFSTKRGYRCPAG